MKLRQTLAAAVMGAAAILTPSGNTYHPLPEHLRQEMPAITVEAPAFERAPPAHTYQAAISAPELAAPRPEATGLEIYRMNMPAPEIRLAQSTRPAPQSALEKSLDLPAPHIALANSYAAEDAPGPETARPTRARPAPQASSAAVPAATTEEPAVASTPRQTQTAEKAETPTPKSTPEIRAENSASTSAPATNRAVPAIRTTRADSVPERADFSLGGITARATRQEYPVPKTRLANLADRNVAKELLLMHPELSTPLPGLSSMPHKHTPLGHNVFRSVGKTRVPLLVQSELNYTHDSAFPSTNLSFRPLMTDALHPAIDLALALETEIEPGLRAHTHPLQSGISIGAADIGAASLEYRHKPRLLTDHVEGIDVFGEGPRAHAILDLDLGSDERVIAEGYYTRLASDFSHLLGLERREQELRQQYLIGHYEDKHTFVTATSQRGSLHTETIEDGITTRTHENVFFTAGEMGASNETSRITARMYVMRRGLGFKDLSLNGLQLSARHAQRITENTILTATGRVDLAGSGTYLGGHAELARRVGPVTIYGAIAQTRDPLGPWRLGNSVIRFSESASTEAQQTNYAEIGLRGEIGSHRFSLSIEPTKDATVPWIEPDARIKGRAANATYSYAGTHHAFAIGGAFRDLSIHTQEAEELPGAADTEYKAIYTYSRDGLGIVLNLNHRIGNHFPLRKDRNINLGTQTILNASISKDIGPFSVSASWINMLDPVGVDNIIGAYERSSEPGTRYISLPSVPGGNISLSIPLGQKH